MSRTQCPICHGSGTVTMWTGGKRERRDCPECDGLGYVQPDYYDSNGGQYQPPAAGPRAVRHE